MQADISSSATTWQEQELSAAILPDKRLAHRLPPVQDRLHDIRRQQREAQKARYAGRVNLLRVRQFVDGVVVSRFKHSPPRKALASAFTSVVSAVEGHPDAEAVSR